MGKSKKYQSKIILPDDFEDVISNYPAKGKKAKKKGKPDKGKLTGRSTINFD